MPVHDELLGALLVVYRAILDSKEFLACHTAAQYWRISNAETMHRETYNSYYTQHDISVRYSPAKRDRRRCTASEWARISAQKRRP